MVPSVVWCRTMTVERRSEPCNIPEYISLTRRGRAGVLKGSDIEIRHLTAACSVFRGGALSSESRQQFSHCPDYGEREPGMFL